MPTNTNTPLLTEVFPNLTGAAAPVNQPAVIGKTNSAAPAPAWWGGSVTNQDDGSHPEDQLTLPWVVPAALSWLDYSCVIVTELDPGTVLHKPLPQGPQTVDSLASVDVSNYGIAATAQGGLNLQSNSQAVDLIQQMATSTYRFVLRGYGLRAGYQVPVPGLVRVGNLQFVPTWPHRAFNEPRGYLLGGIPLWYAEWELHYLVANSPKLSVPLAAANPAAKVRPDMQLPASVSVPDLPTDQNAVQAAPINLSNRGVTGGFR